MRTASAHQEERATRIVAERMLSRWGSYIRVNRVEYLGIYKINPVERARVGSGVRAQQIIIDDMPDEVRFINDQVSVMPTRLRLVAECKWRDGLKDKAGALKLNKMPIEQYRVSKLMVIERVDAVLSSL
jgi:hypothetical protein